jgi:hypothetical protein
MRRLAILVTVLAMAGCGSTGVKNKVDAQLMPESVAKKEIIAKYFGRAWAENPTGRYQQGFAALCGENARGPMPYEDINVLRYFEWSKTKHSISVEKVNWFLMTIPCQIMAHKISGTFTKVEVNDIVDALVSLGAKIDEVKRL